MSAASLYGFDTAGLDQLSAGPGGSEQSSLIGNTPSSTEGMGTGAIQAMNSGSSIGGMVTSAGVYGAMSGAALGPAGIGAGLAISAYENSQKADAMNEQARVKEATDRKAAVQSALTQALRATRQLGV